MAIPIFDALLGVADTVLERVVPDKNERDKLAHELATMGEKNTHALLQGQLEVNKVEAASKSLFKGGWRPFVGWVCGIAFANNFIIAPYVEFIWGGSVQADWETMSPILLGMLGLAGMRTGERVKGKA